jgi:hypothetical protein
VWYGEYLGGEVEEREEEEREEDDNVGRRTIHLPGPREGSNCRGGICNGGIIFLGDVVEDPHEGPPWRAPPPPPSLGVVVLRGITVVVIGVEAILALVLE